MAAAVTAASTAARDAAEHAVALYLVRHGAADGADGRCIGQRDLPLSPRGRDEITRLAAAWPMPRPARVIASDLARARDSAEVLAGAWNSGARIATDTRLREMDFGAWDGRPWTDIQDDDGAAMSSWMERCSAYQRLPNSHPQPPLPFRSGRWPCAPNPDHADEHAGRSFRAA